MVEVSKAIDKVTEEDIKLLNQIKRTVTKTSDAVVKRSKDGKYNVYENKITKVS